MLRATGRSDVRVFVVWEPVLTTDWGTPSQALTANVPEPEVTHFWDPNRRLSALYGGPTQLARLAHRQQVGFRIEDVLWDAALLYRPGARWGSAAALLVAPVAKYRGTLAQALAR